MVASVDTYLRYAEAIGVTPLPPSSLVSRGRRLAEEVKAVKKRIRRDEAKRQVRKLTVQLLVAMREAGCPIEEGQGDIKTEEKACKIELEIEEILYNAVRRDCIVYDY